MGTIHSFFLLVSFGMLVVISNTQLCTRHLEFTPVHQFNTSRILGNWTVFKSYAAEENDTDASPLQCLMGGIAVSDIPDMLPLTYIERWIDNDGNEGLEGFYIGLDDINEAVWYGATFPSKLLFSVFVQTDYDNWAIQFRCTETPEMDMHEQMVILTKTSTPDEGLVSILQVLVQNYGFSLANEIPIDHSNCE